MTLGLMLTTFFLSMLVLFYETYRNVRKCLIRRAYRKEQKKLFKKLNKVQPESGTGWNTEDPNSDNKRSERDTKRNLIEQDLCIKGEEQRPKEKVLRRDSLLIEEEGKDGGILGTIREGISDGDGDSFQFDSK